MWKYPVHARGVITTVGPDLKALWFQDETAGIYISSPNFLLSTNLAVGDEVEVEGLSAPGGFSPVIEATAVKAVGKGKLPEARLMTLFQMATGQFDNQWIEVRGVVRSFRTTQQSVNFELSDVNGLVEVNVPGGAVFTNLMDSLVRVRGVCRSRFTPSRQITGVYIWMPTTNCLEVVEQGVADPFTLPARPIFSLSEFRQAHAPQHRIKIAGVVTFSEPGRPLFVQDETGGVPVYLTQAVDFKAGDRVEAVGYLSLGDFRYVLRDADCRRTGHASIPAPRPASDETLNQNLHGLWVQLNARVVNGSRRGNEDVMTLQAGNLFFEALRPIAANSGENPLPPIGSLVQLRGVYSVLGDELRVARALRLYVPPAEPIQILEKPSWWNARHAVAVVGTMAVTLLAAALWAILLRRRVAAQTLIIRERLEKEAALQERYREIFEGANDVILTCDLEGRLTSLNPAGQRAVGYSGMEVNPLTLDQILAPDSRKAVQELRESKLADGNVATCECEFVARDGRRSLVETSLRLMLKDGKPHSIQAIGRDITERKKAEAALAEASSLLQTLLDNVPDVIYFKDRQSRFVRVSKSTAENALRHGARHPGFSGQANGMAGQPPSLDQVERFAQCLPGKSDFDLFTEEHARPAFEDEQEIIRTGQPLIGKLEKETHADGSSTWTITTKMPWRDKDENIVGTIGISKDLTAMQEAQAKLDAVRLRLIETSRLAGMAEVATDVLHNVGNVLNSVNVSCSLAIDQVKSSKMPNLFKVTAMLEENCGRLGEFFTSDPRGQQVPGYLVGLARHLAGEQTSLLKELQQLVQNIDHIKQIVAMQQRYAKVAGVLETVSPRQLVEDALHINAAALARHQVQVRSQFEETPQITTEKHKVLQILVNLISNAKYAMDDAKRPDKLLTIKVVNDGDDHVKIQVIDNGIGIPRENLTRIFSPGFTTRPTGHGFGLHSSALTVRELGGSLAAASEGPGTGAVFTLLLPTVLRSNEHPGAAVTTNADVEALLPLNGL